MNDKSDVPCSKDPDEADVPAGAQESHAQSREHVGPCEMIPADEKPIIKRMCDSQRSKLYLSANGRESFYFGFPGLFGQVTWNKEWGYYENDSILPSRYLSELARTQDVQGCLSEDSRGFVFEKLLAYPMYEGNWGKAGQDINILSLRRESTHRQCHYWVFDDKERGLISQPFILCEVEWNPEVKALLNDDSNLGQKEDGTWIEKVSQMLSDNENLLDHSGIAETLAESGIITDSVQFKFSSHRFDACQGVLHRKRRERAFLTKYYYESPSGKTWDFDISLYMFYRSFPRRIYFHVAPK
jgi:hypothetical protein